ncbi:ABC transporter permease [Ohtaekwangia sp.]|uniref:ABC transporter permease n=1 Tax=Ohtaekwangia sp. TaxID=2066019 RepID=UPI002FDC8D16
MVFNFSKALSFIKKDYCIESSYKMAFLISVANSFLPIISFFFVSKLIESSQAESLARYGGEYFPFALIGIAFTRFFQLAILTFADSIRRSQMAGCLEAVLCSQTNPKSIVFMSSFYSFISAGVQLILMFVVGILFFDFDISRMNVPGTLVAMVLSLFTFISLGIFAASGTILFKKGEPFGYVASTLSSILGGAYFPIAIMPAWLQLVSVFVPITYSLDALRLTMLQNYSIGMISEQLLILALVSVVLFPLSLKTFEWAVEKGKRDGTLVQH